VFNTEPPVQFFVFIFYIASAIIFASSIFQHGVRAIFLWTQNYFLLKHFSVCQSKCFSQQSFDPTCHHKIKSIVCRYPQQSPPLVNNSSSNLPSVRQSWAIVWPSPTSSHCQLTPSIATVTAERHLPWLTSHSRSSHNTIDCP
jgi:hypothetical protein